MSNAFDCASPALAGDDVAEYGEGAGILLNDPYAS
jgi:hypothetical protein